jgi:hypothetical protein
MAGGRNERKRRKRGGGAPHLAQPSEQGPGDGSNARSSLLSTPSSVPQPTAGNRQRFWLIYGPLLQPTPRYPTFSVIWLHTYAVASPSAISEGKPASEHFLEKQLSNGPVDSQPMRARQRKKPANAETTTKRASQRFDRALPQIVRQRGRSRPPGIQRPQLCLITWPTCARVVSKCSLVFKYCISLEHI